MELHLGPGEISLLTIVLGALIAVIRYVFKLWKDQQDTAIAELKKEREAAIAELKKEREAAEAELKADRDNYRSVAGDAVRMMQSAVTRAQEAKILPPLRPLAAVEPEHQSPVSEKEETAAHQATLRAAVTAAALLLGEPPRSDPPGRKPAGNRPEEEDVSAGKTQEPKVPEPDKLVSQAAAVEAVLQLPETPEPPAESPEA